MGKIKVLQNCRPFQQLSPTELAVLSTVIDFVRLEKGATLFDEGHAGDSMYIVTSGEIGISSENLQLDDASLKLVKGETLGEVGLLGENPHFTSATVLSATAELVCLKRESMQLLLETRPQIGFKVLSAISSSLAEKVRRALPA